MTDAEINEAVARGLGTFERVSRSSNDAGVLVWEKANQIGRHVSWAQSLDACVRDLVSEMYGRGYVMGVQQFDDGSYQVNWWRGENGKALIRDNPPRSETLPRAICLAWLKAAPARPEGSPRG